MIKSKVGLDHAADVARLQAIRGGHPTCQLLLDANEGYDAPTALRLIRLLRSEGIEPVLFEQPVPREDWEGLGRVAREAGVPVAADESCRSPQDALRIAHEGLAQVLNIKLAKCGVLGALEIATIGRAAGLSLMIGGMVETRLGMGFAAHLVAGQGAFSWVDLDTPLLLAADPVSGGYRAQGPSYTVATGESGHGGRLASPKRLADHAGERLATTPAHEVGEEALRRTRRVGGRDRGIVGRDQDVREGPER